MNTYVIITLITLVTSLLGYMARLLFASKCSNFSCGYGCIHVDRQTLEESKDIQIQGTASVTKEEMINHV
jgi:hypothetical protein